MCKVATITFPSLVCLRRTVRRWRSVQGAAPRRFVVFLELLRQAEEEYGFPAAPGPIALSCDEDSFLDVLHRVYMSSSASACFFGPAAAQRGRGDARPLLQEKLVW